MHLAAASQFPLYRSGKKHIWQGRKKAIINNAQLPIFEHSEL